MVALGDEQNASGTVDAGGELHADIQLVHHHFANQTRQGRRLGALEEKPGGIGIESRARLLQDTIHGLLLR